MTTARQYTPISVNSAAAQRMASRELAKPQYHVPSPAASASAISTPSTATPTPPPQHTTSSGNAGVIIAVVLATILLVIAAALVVRALSGSRAGRKKDRPSAKNAAGGDESRDDALTGAARLRHEAELAARTGDWVTAIQLRFRAVVSALDELGLLPERPERTADEAAFDAGLVLPAHASVLISAARVFDEVEYGGYQGTPENYALISRADQAVQSVSAMPALIPSPMTTPTPTPVPPPASEPARSER